MRQNCTPPTPALLPRTDVRTPPRAVPLQIHMHLLVPPLPGIAPALRQWQCRCCPHAPEHAVRFVQRGG